MAGGLASLGSGVALASETTQAPTPSGAPAGATTASATAVYSELSYRGTAQRGHELWYQVSSEGEQEVLVNVWGRTSSCPIRAALLDARGRTLGEIISSTSEILPFAVRLPAHQVSGSYYLRVDTDPYMSCARAGYVLKLIEPERPIPPPPLAPVPCTHEPCTVTPPATATLPSRETAVPLLEERSCYSDQSALRNATVAVEAERALARRHRASVTALRKVEAQKLAARRRERAACGY